MTMMMRYVVMAMMVVCLGCSGGESKSSSTGQAGGAGQEGSAGVDVTGAAAKVSEIAGAVNNCLSLVSSKNWVEAVPACTRAVGLDPNNQKVQSALTTAKENVASVADAKQAASDAMGNAKASADSATKAAQDASKNANDAADAAKGMLGGMH
jgi:hypothetical protein